MGPKGPERPLDPGPKRTQKGPKGARKGPGPNWTLDPGPKRTLAPSFGGRGPTTTTTTITTTTTTTTTTNNMYIYIYYLYNDFYMDFRCKINGF